MTRKLEELFDLPTDSVDDGLANEVAPDNVPEPTEDNIPVLKNARTELEKVEAALPQVRGLEASDQEMDELAVLAKDKFEDLMELGMNMDPRFGGQVFQTAGTLLGHAITAKTAKMDKKLRMVQLQLQKAKLDHQASKDAPEDTAVDGQGVVLDRNALLDQILQNSKK